MCGSGDPLLEFWDPLISGVPSYSERRYSECHYLERSYSRCRLSAGMTEFLPKKITHSLLAPLIVLYQIKRENIYAEQTVHTKVL